MNFYFTPEELTALWLSLKVAAWCTLLAVIPATILAWVLARFEFRGKSLLEALLFLPLVLPPVVIGYMLLVLFGREGYIGAYLNHMGIRLTFHWTGAVLASFIMCLPLFIQSIRIAFQNIDIRLEQSAQLLGASPWRVFFTITLPLSWSGIVSGAILAFGRSLGEFGATITFVGNLEGETRTLPLAIYTAVQNSGTDATAFRLVWLSMGLALLVLWWGNLLQRRQLRKLGHRHA